MNNEVEMNLGNTIEAEKAYPRYKYYKRNTPQKGGRKIHPSPTYLQMLL